MHLKTYYRRMAARHRLGSDDAIRSCRGVVDGSVRPWLSARSMVPKLFKFGACILTAFGKKLIERWRTCSGVRKAPLQMSWIGRVRTGRKKWTFHIRGAASEKHDATGVHISSGAVLRQISRRGKVAVYAEILCRRLCGNFWGRGSPSSRLPDNVATGEEAISIGSG